MAEVDKSKVFVRIQRDEGDQTIDVATLETYETQLQGKGIHLVHDSGEKGSDAAVIAESTARAFPEHATAESATAKVAAPRAATKEGDN